MEPVPSPPWAGAPTMMSPPPSTRLPRNVLIGFILAGLGVVLSGISYGWSYFGIRSGFATAIVTYIQVDIILSVTEFLCIEVGLFLVFLGILRLLPRVHLWSRLGPFLILAGSIVVAAIDLVEAALIAMTYPPSTAQVPNWAAYAILATLVAGYVVTTLGLVVSLFAVAKGVLLRTSAAPGVPQP